MNIYIYIYIYNIDIASTNSGLQVGELAPAGNWDSAAGAQGAARIAPRSGLWASVRAYGPGSPEFGAPAMVRTSPIR